MCEVNCTNCRVSAFKHGFCPDDFCEKHKALGTEDDFIRTLQCKVGKWETCLDDHDKWFICPVCHWQTYEATNYCPNCGTKMDGRW